MNNYPVAITIARTQGYNEVETLWPADAEAVMMQDKLTELSSALPCRAIAAGWTVAVFGLLSVCDMLRAKKRRFAA